MLSKRNMEQGTTPPPETPETPQTTAPPVQNLEMADLAEGAELMAALKRGKGQAAGKWDALAETAKTLAGSAAEQTPQPLPPFIPKFSGADGHRLTPEEQVADIQAKQPHLQMPKFHQKEGHKLTPEEQIVEFGKLHSIQ